MSLDYLDEDKISVANQFLRVFINTVIVNQEAGLATLHSIPDAAKKLLAMLSSSRDKSFLFVVCRLMFYLSLKKEQLASLAKEGAWKILVQVFLDSTTPAFWKNVDCCRCASESLKVMFLLNSDYPLDSELRPQMVLRASDILSQSLSEVHDCCFSPTPQPGLYSVKCDLINLLYTEQQIPPPQIAESEGVLKGILELLEIQAQADSREYVLVSFCLKFVELKEHCPQYYSFLRDSVCPISSRESFSKLHCLKTMQNPSIYLLVRLRLTSSVPKFLDLMILRLR